MTLRAQRRGRFNRALAAFRAIGPPRARVRPDLNEATRDSGRPLARIIAEQLLSRVAGVPPIEGNSVRLLQDGAENYAAWLDAIAKARHGIDFENYIIRNDAVGRRFADALCARARAGIPVRVLYDWLGCLGTGRRFWHALRGAGVDVRCFNRPRLDSPLGWLSRNHRKTLCCDGQVGFVSGLCVGDEWVGDAARGVAAWRDTGIELRGPAVAGLAAAFAQSWAHAGGETPPAGTPEPPGPAGAISLRVIGSKPSTMGLYRFDQLIAGIARRSLWLTDAYFVGTTAYTQTLCDAARDGVDVRLLVPGASDIPVAKALSRAGYRPLLDAGIRVFEWNGPMLHAKTAVADGRWARIGSSNLNLASWMGNWELDVAVEDAGFAERMEAMFRADLLHATEIVLDLGRVHATGPRRQEVRRGSPGRLAAGAVGLGSAVGAALTNHRALGPAEARVMASGAGVLLALAGVGLFLPFLLTVPLALAACWIALTLLVRAWRLKASNQPPA